MQGMQVHSYIQPDSDPASIFYTAKRRGRNRSEILAIQYTTLDLLLYEHVMYHEIHEDGTITTFIMCGLPELFSSYIYYLVPADINETSAINTVKIFKSRPSICQRCVENVDRYLSGSPMV